MVPGEVDSTEPVAEPEQPGSQRGPRRRRELADLDDPVLVARARDGDPRAFEVLIRRQQRPMFALAVRMLNDSAAAEDAVQNAFIQAWRKLPAFREEARFSTWLYRIVTNECLSALRRRRRTEPLPDRDDLQPPLPEHLSPQASAEHHALGAALAGALKALPDDLRVAWLLREADHRSYDEIAAITETSVSTVRGRIARARATLAHALEEWR